MHKIDFEKAKSFWCWLRCWFLVQISCTWFWSCIFILNYSVPLWGSSLPSVPKLLRKYSHEQINGWNVMIWWLSQCLMETSLMHNTHGNPQSHRRGRIRIMTFQRGFFNEKILTECESLNALMPDSDQSFSYKSYSIWIMLLLAKGSFEILTSRRTMMWAGGTWVSEEELRLLAASVTWPCTTLLPPASMLLQHGCRLSTPTLHCAPDPSFLSCPKCHDTFLWMTMCMF